jgi:hypothetical protein
MVMKERMNFDLWDFGFLFLGFAVDFVGRG